MEGFAGSKTSAPLRVSVVGSSGSGKSFLARQLAARLGVPVYDLDELKRRPDGSLLPANEFAALVDQLTQQEVWILDGHYRDVRHMIWSRAQAVIWLNYPLFVVAQRLFSRFYKNRNGKARAHSVQAADWSLEAGRGPVYPATWGHRFKRLMRTMRERREYRALLGSSRYRHVQCVELSSPRIAQNWLNSLGNEGQRDSAAATGVLRHSTMPSWLALLGQSTILIP